MNIGYARVSTFDQNLDMQIDALKKAGCEKIITEKMSGAIKERPGLSELKNILRKEDNLVVWRLDRIGRSLSHLIGFIQSLEREGIGFISLQETINTTTASGRLIFHIFGALCEFERNLIRERTNAGLLAARSRGKYGGRPEKLTPKKQLFAIDLYKSQKYSIHTICETLGISKPTLYKYIHNQNTLKR